LNGGWGFHTPDQIDPWMTSGEYQNMMPHTWQIDKYKKKHLLQDFIYGIPEYILKL
jgi:hypothetical protein